MKQYLMFILTLLVGVGQGLYAEDFADPGVSTAAVTAPIPVPEPFLWPVAKTIGGRRTKIVSKFGRRKIPTAGSPSGTAPVTGADETHEGIDFGLAAGAHVRASRTGKVLFAGYSTAYVSRAKKTEKSHLVIIRHSDGQSTRYVHLDKLLVKPGTEIKAGDVLGTSSASDEWTEPVLHFEIREANGRALDPMIFLTEAPKTK